MLDRNFAPFIVEQLGDNCLNGRREADKCGLP